MIVEDEKFEIERIISHRINGDDLEYLIKFQGYDKEEWVSSNYFDYYQCQLLDEYKEENNKRTMVNIIKETLPENVVKVDEVVSCIPQNEDPMKALALDFTQQFRIKCEFGWDEYDNEEIIETVPVFDNIQFGAAEYNLTETISNHSNNVIIQIKKEKNIDSNTDEGIIPPQQEKDITLPNENANQSSNITPDYLASSHVILDPFPRENIILTPNINISTLNNNLSRTNESVPSQINIVSIQNNNNMDIQISNTISLSINPESIKNVINSTDTINLSETPAFKSNISTNELVIKDIVSYKGVVDVEMQSMRGNKESSDNISTKKSILIGKVKKATKPIIETKAVDEKRTVKSLLSPAQLSATPDPLDQIFYNLPVFTKVIPEISEPTDEKLKTLTLDTLLGIVNKNNLTLLQKYSHGYLTKNLEHILKNNNYFLVKATENNFISMVGALLELGADVNGRDLNGMTSLMVACDLENEAILDLLINNGALINRITDGKNELLIRCIKNKKQISFKFLLNAGIDFTSVESLINDQSSMFVKFLDEHKKNLLLWIEESILVQLGPHVKVNQMVMAPRVLSLFEVQESKVEVLFPSNISAIIENHCNLLFLVTGLLHGTSMKCLISDANKIISVSLNDIKQQSLTEGHYVNVSSFNPLQEGPNKLIVEFEKDKCRKIRLILVAFNILVKECL